MLKRILIIILSSLITLLFVSCNTTASSVEIGRNGPIEVEFGESRIIGTQTIYIHYYNDYVIKTIYTEESKLTKNGKYDDLKNYANAIENTFSKDMFKVEGFEYSSELDDTSFTSKITIDYTKLNENDLSDDVKEFFYGKGLNMIDKDSNVIYDKMLETYTKFGFVFDKEQ